MYIYFTSPTKSIIVSIDLFGEANIEFLVMLFIIPISFLGFCYMFKDMIKKKDTNVQKTKD